MAPGKAAISAFSRQRQLRNLPPPIFVSERSAEKNGRPGEFTIALDRVVEEHPLPQVGKRLDKALTNLALLSAHPGDRVKLGPQDYALLYSENVGAALYLLKQLHIKRLIVENTDQLPTEVSLTVDGWNRIAELQQGEGVELPKQAFVAMWFHEEMVEAFEKGIKVAVVEAGYAPMRIDLKEHNNQITDEIVAEIRRSRFLVADFTGHRAGVYYEAGLMQGLGRQVIFTCRKDCIGEAHFDTRQFNHIVWETPEDLRVKLLRRIQATVLA